MCSLRDEICCRFLDLKKILCRSRKEKRRRKKRAKCCQAREKSAAILRSIGYSEWGNRRRRDVHLAKYCPSLLKCTLVIRTLLYKQIGVPSRPMICTVFVSASSICWSCFEKTPIVLEQRTDGTTSRSELVEVRPHSKVTMYGDVICCLSPTPQPPFTPHSLSPPFLFCVGKHAWVGL